MREVTIERNTNETQIELTLNLDGAGRYQVDTGCGFLNHMLELFARHGRFDLVLTCHGDVEVDYHHTTEDVGIALGQAFAEALGDMRGIHRYGSFYLPMDEALILCAVDISGRCTLNWGDVIKEIIEKKDQLQRLGEENRKFVLKYHDHIKIAQQYLDLWKADLDK